MENLAHALCGLAIADLGFRERVGRRAGVVAVIAANLPDADILLALHGRDTYLWWHRGITHSVFGAPILGFLGAAVSARLLGGRYRDHLALWAWALLSHLLLDWPTTWGTMLLLPLTDTRFSLDWIFIVDPMFWVLLGLLPWALRRRMERPAAARAGLFALAGWILTCGVLHQQAGTHAPPGTEVFPAPLAPLQWTGVSPGVRRWWLTPWSGEAAGAFTPAEGPEVDAVKGTYAGDRWFWMAHAPVLKERREREDGSVDLTFADLAFTSRWSPEPGRFRRTFVVDAEGRVVGR